MFSGLAGLVLLPVFGLLFQQPGCGLRRFLECPPVQFLGRISYSLYLTHWVVLSLVLLLVPLSWPAPTRCAAALMLGVPAGIVVASVFYRLFEHPYLSQKRPRSPLSPQSWGTGKDRSLLSSLAPQNWGRGRISVERPKQTP